MSQQRPALKLGFPGLPDKKYQQYREQLRRADQTADKAAQKLRRAGDKPLPDWRES